MGSLPCQHLLISHWLHLLLNYCLVLSKWMSNVKRYKQSSKELIYPHTIYSWAAEYDSFLAPSLDPWLDFLGQLSQPQVKGYPQTNYSTSWWLGLLFLGKGEIWFWIISIWGGLRKGGVSHFLDEFSSDSKHNILWPQPPLLPLDIIFFLLKFC